MPMGGGGFVMPTTGMLSGLPLERHLRISRMSFGGLDDVDIFGAASGHDESSIAEIESLISRRISGTNWFQPPFSANVYSLPASQTSPPSTSASAAAGSAPPSGGSSVPSGAAGSVSGTSPPGHFAAAANGYMPPLSSPSNKSSAATPSLASLTKPPSPTPFAPAAAAAAAAVAAAAAAVAAEPNAHVPLALPLQSASRLSSFDHQDISGAFMQARRASVESALRSFASAPYASSGGGSGGAQRVAEWDAVLATHAKWLRTDARLPEYEAASAQLQRAMDALEARLRSTSQ